MRKLRLEELGRLDPQAYRQAPKRPITVVLDNVRSGHNVGSILRSADAFRVEKVWLCGFTPAPPHRDIRKTALGAEDSVDWARHPDAAILIRDLKNQGYHILAAEQTDASLPLPSFEGVKKPLVLVLGNEVDGVGDAVIAQVDGALEIPQFGTKHSLNVSVAAGIFLYALAEKIGF